MTSLIALFWDCEQDAKIYLQDLNAKYLLPFLLDNKAITEDDVSLLQLKHKSTENVTEELMTLLSEKDDYRTFNVFLKALRHDNAYYWIADKLEQWKTEKEKHDDALSKGVVPFSTVPHVGRKELVYKVQDALRNSYGRGRSWIVIHGMLGIGKTVLAAKALRDPCLSVYFPDGIYWIAIGKAEEDNQLLLKMQLLCDHFDKDYRADTVESCYRFLRNVTLEHRRSLLILDDVWSQKVLTAFDIGWTVLVTTRDESVVSHLLMSQVTFISVTSGFTLEESRKYFATVLNCNENDLPEDASLVHEKYKGNPMGISMVGSYMRKYGNDGRRWQNVSVKAKESSGRQRRTSSNTQNIYRAVELSLDDLDPELKAYYNHFALFSDDLYIKRKVFEVLWDMNGVDAEEILEDLVQKSLLTKVNEKEVLSSDEHLSEGRSTSYAIHDILLEYLKENVPDDVVVELHQKMVQNYLKLCKLDENGYDFQQLPDDDYIHIFLAHHLYKSRMFKLFPLIFLDLRFVEVKLKHTGPADLIHDYSNYKSCFGEEEKARQDFERFIRQKAHLLSSSSSGNNVYQLALQESPDSDVHKIAMRLIKNTPSSDKLFFKWCNASESHNVMLLSAKPHSTGSSVSDVVFSHDNAFLISVGEDQIIRFLEAHSGRVFQEYFGHKGIINQCCISASGDMIATAASDKTVRLWNVPKLSLGNKETKNGPTTPRPRSGSFPFTPTLKNEQLVYEGHNDNVLCCTFSNNEELVVSGSTDGYVHVWKKEDGTLVKYLKEHKLEVTCVCFSKDDRYVATASRDSTVFVWDTTSWSRVDDYHHRDSPAVYCRFTSNMSLISAAGKLVCKWRLGFKKPIRSYNNLKTMYSITCCALSPDELFVAGGTSLKYVVVWSTKAGDVQATLKGHCDTITCVHYSTDGSMLVSASSDGAIFMWDMMQASKLSIVSFTKEMSVIFREYHPLIAILNEVNSIQLFKDMSGKSKDCFDEETDEVTTCCLSPDCNYIFYGTKTGFISRYNIMLKRIEKILDCSLPVEGCAVTADNKIVVTVFGGNLQIFDNRKILRYEDKKGNVVQTKVKKNHLLSCYENGTANIVDMEEYRKIIEVHHGDETVTTCDATENFDFLVTASVDKWAKIWRVKDKELVFSKEFDDCVRKCCFSPCGKYLAVGTDDGGIQVILWKTSTSVACFEAHSDEAWVNDIQFSPDSKSLVSVSNSIKWWKINGEPLGMFIVKGGEIKRIYCCSSFSVFVTVDSMGVLYILQRVL